MLDFSRKVIRQGKDGLWPHHGELAVRQSGQPTLFHNQTMDSLCIGQSTVVTLLPGHILASQREDCQAKAETEHVDQRQYLVRTDVVGEAAQEVPKHAIPLVVSRGASAQQPAPIRNAATALAPGGPPGPSPSSPSARPPAAPRLRPPERSTAARPGRAGKGTVESSAARTSPPPARQ